MFDKYVYTRIHDIPVCDKGTRAIMHIIYAKTGQFVTI